VATIAGGDTMTTFAKISLNSCPSISAYIRAEGTDKFVVSVCLTETGGAYYPTDPAESYNLRLGGEYAVDPGRHSYLHLPGLPKEIHAAAKASIAFGDYNNGPCRDFFTARALNFFAPLPDWHRGGGREEYARLLDAAVAKIDQLREKSDTGRLDSLCLALGLSRG